MEHFYYNSARPLNFNSYYEPFFSRSSLLDNERLMNKPFVSNMDREYNHLLGSYLESSTNNRMNGWGWSDRFSPVHSLNSGFNEGYYPYHGFTTARGFNEGFLPSHGFNAARNVPEQYIPNYRSSIVRDIRDVRERSPMGLISENGIGMDGRYDSQQSSHSEQHIHEPATYLIEENDCTVVQVELFGVSDKDFNVLIMGNNLVIEGFKEISSMSTHKSKNTQQAKLYFMGPVWHGAFKRVITLDWVLESSAVSASFSNGVLTLTIKKPQTHKAEFVKVVSK